MKSSNTAQRLSEYMAKNNLKQVDIIRRAEPYCQLYSVKLNKSDLSQYVSGKVEPGQDKLFVLARALNVPEAWLMGYDMPEEKPTPIDFDNKPIKNIEDMSPEELNKYYKGKGISELLDPISELIKEFNENILDIQADNVRMLIYQYSTLNHEGKKELLKRAIELNELKRYTYTTDESDKNEEV